MPINWYNIFFKYKVLHVIMWGLVGTSTFFAYYDPASTKVPQIFNALAVVVTSTIPFYSTAYVLIPRLLYKRKFVLFIILLLIQVVVTGLFTLLTVRYVDKLFDPSLPIIPPPDSLGPIINLFIWNSMIATFGAGGLKILSDRFRIEKKLHAVEKEKISTELNFLRSQVNPHYLFNLINTIYFQIDRENTQARASVEKLSEMLRYQLYECTNDQIEIKKELDYIRNYVAMQTLRMEKGSDIKLQIDENLQGFRIAPLLILPMVENAFKHVSNFKEACNNKIHISLQHDKNKVFIVQVSNTYDKTNTVNHIVNSGGLGVVNLKRRLELLYPGRHELAVNKEDSIFNTTLKIQYYD
jgi:two-component system LytT family sensor kinase